MILSFYKFEATGNDFIFLNQSDLAFISSDQLLSKQLVRTLCARAWGIGADGLILFAPDRELDFQISYFNSDGSSGMLCGNGARAAILFAYRHLAPKNNYVFRVGKQIYQGFCQPVDNQDFRDKVSTMDSTRELLVTLKIPDIHDVRKLESSHYYAHTGAPHKVVFCSEPLGNLDLVKLAQKYRYGVNGEIGANVNLLYYDGDLCYIRTFEKGVEAETLSCGTGAIACALSWSLEQSIWNDFAIKIHSLGGVLQVKARREMYGFSNIELTGMAREVFYGYYPMDLFLYDKT